MDGGTDDSSSSSSSSSGDDASVVDEKIVDEDPLDPLEILIHPLPPQPEGIERHHPVVADENEGSDDDDVNASASPFDTLSSHSILMLSSQAPKKKKETKLEKRVTAIENKLENIEKLLKDAKIDGFDKLLQEVLAATKAATKV